MALRDPKDVARNAVARLCQDEGRPVENIIYHAIRDDRAAVIAEAKRVLQDMEAKYLGYDDWFELAEAHAALDAILSEKG